MNSAIASIALAGFWGLCLGLVYFGGLWLTVRRLPASPRPHRLWVMSYGLRLTFLLIGVWPMLQQARYTPLAPFVGIASILAVRLLMTRTLGLTRPHRSVDA